MTNPERIGPVPDGDRGPALDSDRGNERALRLLQAPRSAGQAANFNLRDEVRGLRHALRMVRRALELEEHDLARDVAARPAEYNRCADCDYPLHLALGRVPRCPACGEKLAWAH